MRKSSRLNVQTKQDYIPGLKGSKYAVALSHLEDHGALYTDAHMLFMKTKEEQPYFITAVMIKLSLKAGLK